MHGPTRRIVRGDDPRPAEAWKNAIGPVDCHGLLTTGKVAAERRDLDFDGLKNSYGIGMRLVGVDGYAFRVEVARSEEHKARLIFSAGGSF